MRIVPDYVRADSWIDSALIRAGVPAEHWKANISTLRFTKCRFGKTTLAPAAQRSGLKQIWTDPRDQLAVLASETEGPALAAACSVLRNLISVRIYCTLVAADQMWRIRKMDKEENKRLRCFVACNLLANATQPRIQDVRDSLWHNRYKARLVVVTGTTDPYEFSVKNFGFRPTVCCLLKDSPN